MILTLSLTPCNTVFRSRSSTSLSLIFFTTSISLGSGTYLRFAGALDDAAGVVDGRALSAAGADEVVGGVFEVAEESADERN